MHAPPCVQELMKAALKDAGGLTHADVTAATTWQAWTDALEAAAAAADTAGQAATAEKLRALHPNYRRTYYDELVGRAKSKSEEEEARRRRARDKLASYMKHARGMKDGAVSWDEFMAEHGKEPEVKAVSDELMIHDDDP